MASQNNSISFSQLNMQHSKASSLFLGRYLGMKLNHISLFQEPYYWDNFLTLRNLKGNVFFDSKSKKPRAGIFASKALDACLLHDFCSRDFVAILLKYKRNNEVRKLICCSAYFQYEQSSPPDTRYLERIVNFALLNKFSLVVGIDANSQNEMWGSSKTNARGINLIEFIYSKDLMILNSGNKPTFVNSVRDQVIDITLCSHDVVNDLLNWNVTNEVTCSDHRLISFDTLSDKSLTMRFRNPKNINWSVFNDRLEDRLGEWHSNVDSIEEIEAEVKYLNVSIISSYEMSCPLKTVSEKTNTSWWCSELAVMRKDVRKKFNRRLRDREAYNLALKSYKKACRNLHRGSFRSFCESVKTVSQTARLQKILNKDSNNKLNALTLPSGERLVEGEEILENLFNSHFPGCLKSSDVTFTSHFSGDVVDWHLARKIVTAEGISWAIRSFQPFSSAGVDGIIPALLQFNLPLLINPLLKIFVACLALGYVPKAWQEIRVIFIPKVGKNSYEDPKSHRPICVSSVLLKVLEKLVDFHIKQTALVRSPLQINQHAYQKGKSTESALHRLLDPIERSLESGEFALGVFVDILGAFDNTPFDLIKNSLSSHDVNPTLIRWIVNLLMMRVLKSELKGSSIERTPVRGCPQGGVLSPLLWNIVADGLLSILNSLHVLTVAYADDFPIVVRGKFPGVLFSKMQLTLNTVSEWCNGCGLSVNPDKTSVILFTNKRKISGIKPLLFYGKRLEMVTQVKHLGVILDNKLDWGAHLNHQTKRSCMILGQCRKAIGKNWGLGPKQCLWLYTMVARPVFLYCSLLFWKKLRQQTAQRKINHLQRLACLSVTGAMKSTPTAALELLVGLSPLHLKAEACARATAFRLVATKEWRSLSQDGHSSIWRDMVASEATWSAPSEIVANICISRRSFEIRYPSRSEWQAGFLSGEDHNFYTDGSLRDSYAGSGVFSESTDPNLEISARLGKNISVFQAEVLAISLCANYCLDNGYSGKRVNICSDSQASLKALESFFFGSKLVLECRNSLQKLCCRNTVTLYWVPGHSDIAGNEEADRLARMGSDCPSLSPWPCLPLSRKYFLNLITDWLSFEHFKYWINLKTCRQTRLYLNKVSQSMSNNLLNMSKSNARLVVGLITGHCSLNKHLYQMRLTTSPACLKCGYEEESAFHFVCDCPFYMHLRHKVLGNFVLSLSNYRDLKFPLLLRFIRESKRFDG